MSKVFKVLILAWDKLLVLLAVLFVMIPIDPNHAPFIHRDSGVFNYIGWRILNGEVPYRDIWDHKPPLIFFINALGHFFSDDTTWGVWTLELISLFIAAYFGYRIVKNSLGDGIAIFVLFYWLLTLFFVLEGGNLTEEYALPLQFMCFWLIYKSNPTKFEIWRWITIGIIISLLFFLRQTTIGIGLAIIVYLSFIRIKSREYKQLAKEFLYIFFGFALIAMLIMSYFYIHSALSDFWNASFQYNFIYSKLYTNEFSFVQAIAPLAKNGFLWVSLFGFVFALIWILRGKSNKGDLRTLIIIGIIDLPIEMFLFNFSGRGNPHYCMTLLPSLAIFSGIMLWLISKSINTLVKFNTPTILLTVIAILAILKSGSYWSYRTAVLEIHGFKGYKSVVRFVETSSLPNDTVLFWGAESAYNYYCQRASPSKYVYLYPLYTDGYVTKEMIEGFLDEIIQNHPKYIVDTKRVKEIPFFEFILQSEEIDNKVMFLKTQYVLEKQVNKWDIYKYISNADNPEMYMPSN